MNAQAYSEARENYARLSAPLIRAKCQIYSVMPMVMMLGTGGEVALVECPTPDQSECLRLLDELLEMTMTRCFRHVQREGINNGYGVTEILHLVQIWKNNSGDPSY